MFTGNFKIPVPKVDSILDMFSLLLGNKFPMASKIINTGGPGLCYLPLQLFTELVTCTI